MPDIDLGQVAAIICSTTAPSVTNVVWGYIANPLYPTVITLRYYNGTDWVAFGGAGGAGTLTLNYKAVTTTYQILLTDYTIDGTTGSFDVTLPDATTCPGQVFAVRSSGGGTILVVTLATQTINGSSTYPVTTATAVLLQSTGTEWITI